MTARTALPVERVARLLPLLGSPIDGEALAAARAIGRVLAAAGADFIDLGKALLTAAPSLGPAPSSIALDELRDILTAMRTELRWALSPAQLNFIAGADSHLARHGSLSPRQVDVALDIWRQVRSRAEAAA